jgi:hypothetical protein
VARGSASPEVLARLAKRSEPEILAAVIANPKAPAEDVERLIEIADWNITKLALSEERLTLNVALKFAEHRSLELRNELARFSGTPPELLTILARDSDLDVRLSVAGNAFASNSALIELSQAIDDEVREAVAWNPSASAEVLRHLIDDQVFSIRRFIALHCRLPADLFEALSRDEHERVRCALANNEYLSELEFDRLWLDSSDQVRCIVASRRLASTKWVAKMPQEAIEEARRAAAYQPKTTAEILKGFKFEILDSDVQSP